MKMPQNGPVSGDFPELPSLCMGSFHNTVIGAAPVLNGRETRTTVRQAPDRHRRRARLAPLATLRLDIDQLEDLVVRPTGQGILISKRPRNGGEPVSLRWSTAVQSEWVTSRRNPRSRITASFRRSAKAVWAAYGARPIPSSGATW